MPFRYYISVLFAFLLIVDFDAKADTEESFEIAHPLSKDVMEEKIRGSYGFLSAREPALNQGEYAIVEKFLPFLEEDPDFALEMIEGLTRNNEDLSASFDFVLGNLYYQSNRREDALRSYQNALNKYPDFLRAWRSIGWLRLYSDEYDQALEAFGKAVKLGDTEPDTFGQIGYCSFMLGDHISARAAYSQAMLIDPTNLEWIRGNLASEIALGHTEAAIMILESLTRKQPRERAYWRILANQHVKRNEPTKAAACLEFLRSSGNIDVEEYEMLTSIYLKMESPNLAGEIFLEMLEKDYELNGDSLLFCLNALYQSKQVEIADPLFAAFQASSNNYSDENRAIMYLCNSRRAELNDDLAGAEDFLLKGLEVGQRQGELLVRLGIVRFRRGNTSGSLGSLTLAESYSDSRINSLIAQAQILMSIQEYSTAAEKLESAISEGAGDHARNLYQDCMHAARKRELDRIALNQGDL